MPYLTARPFRILTVAFAVFLSFVAARPSFGQDAASLRQLDERFPEGSGYSEVTEYLAANGFSLSVGRPKNGAFFAEKGYQIMSPYVWFNELPRTFFERCSHNCGYVASFWKRPWLTGAFDDTIRYVWLFEGDILVAVHADHSRWVLRK